jgi:hypothetical protein
MTTTGVEIADGTLTRTDGSIIRVRLRLTTNSLMEGQVVVDKMISRTQLLSPNVQDGDYILEYSYLKAYRELVSVRFGQLVSRSA